VVCIKCEREFKKLSKELTDALLRASRAERLNEVLKAQIYELQLATKPKRLFTDEKPSKNRKI